MNITSIAGVLEIALGLASYFVPQAPSGLGLILISVGLSTLGISQKVSNANAGRVGGIKW